MNSTEKLAKIKEVNPDAILADGFNDAIIGVCGRAGGMGPVVLYDVNKCLEILMERDGMSAEGAVEFFEFNVCGAWVGDETPVFADMFEGGEDA
tara:strand:- start:1071 stop:1352 length:282 start_codon:yes stop_codon:yes gene_type:complete